MRPMTSLITRITRHHPPTWQGATPRLTKRSFLALLLVGVLAIPVTVISHPSRVSGAGVAKHLERREPQGAAPGGGLLDWLARQKRAFCPIAFEATVHQGPNAEKLSLTGTLHLIRKGNEGEVDGFLRLETGFEVPVFGQINGRAANLLFDLGNDVFIVGTGTMLQSLSDEGCLNLKGGGVFAGPHPADVGSWGIGSTFGTGGGGGGTVCSPAMPIIQSPAFNSVGRIRMNGGGSCIQSGATVKVQVPFSTTTYGPFPLQFDSSGAFLVGVYDANTVQPAGTCRIFTVSNPGSNPSSAVTLCR